MTGAQLGLGLGETRGGAELSPCGRYRYTLGRFWDDSAAVALFVMLNPSTADAAEDDPTIRRCIGFARSWGCGGITVANLFAYRATDPRELETADDPVGPDADFWLRELVGDADLTIAAWGAHPFVAPRARAVAALLGEVMCLGTTKDGHPRHPLYVRADTRPIPWSGP